MSDQTHEASRIAIDPVYTRRGDQGETSLPGRHRVAAWSPSPQARSSRDISTEEDGTIFSSQLHFRASFSG